MKRLYGRLLLWLIRPALEAHCPVVDQFKRGDWKVWSGPEWYQWRAAYPEIGPDGARRWRSGEPREKPTDEMIACFRRTWEAAD